MQLAKNIKICQGDSTVFNDLYPNEKEFKHQWYLDGQAISQGTKNEFFAKKAGKYHVVVTTPWCEVKSDTVVIQEMIPDSIYRPIITIDKVIDFCKLDSLKMSVANYGNFSIQWYLNDKEITKAIDSFYYAKLPGKYNIIIKNEGICSFKSDYFDLNKDVCNTSMAKLNIVQDDLISMYPNPATTVLTIDTKAENIHSISFIDILGKSVLQQELKGVRNELNLESIAKGMYVVSFFNDQNEIISSQKLSVE